MTDLLKAAVFACFVGLAVFAAIAHDPERRRRRVNALVAYFLLVSVAVGLTNHDAWPFATYPLVPSRYREDMVARKLEYHGVDAAGREVAVEPEAFAPLYPLTMDIWFEKFYARLSPGDQRRALAFLSDAAERARRDRTDGRRLGSHVVLGPLAAPDWWMYPPVPESPQPFRGLRIDRVTWRPGEALNDPAAFHRQLVAATEP